MHKDYDRLLLITIVNADLIKVLTSNMSILFLIFLECQNNANNLHITNKCLVRIEGITAIYICIMV